MALMFASYQLLVRDSFIGMVLNGRRLPRRTETMVASQSTA